MGFFDRFRKRVQEVADETDFDELTAEEGTEEEGSAGWLCRCRLLRQQAGSLQGRSVLLLW